MKVSHINENLEKRIRSYVKVSLIFLMRVNHYRKVRTSKKVTAKCFNDLGTSRSYLGIDYA